MTPLRLPWGEAPWNTAPGSDELFSRYSCLVCHAVFTTWTGFRWHRDRAADPASGREAGVGGCPGRPVRPVWDRMAHPPATPQGQAAPAASGDGDGAEAVP